MARELEEQEGTKHTSSASIRNAKKSSRPVKITQAQPKVADARSKRKKVSNSMKRKALGKSGFDTDLSKRGGGREGMRAGRSDGVGLGGKKKGGKGGGKGKGRK